MTIDDLVVVRVDGIGRAVAAGKEIPMQFSRIKLCRFASGLLQTELAKRTKIPCARLSALEDGSALPKLDELERLAAVLDVPTDMLVDGETGVPERPLRLVYGGTRR